MREEILSNLKELLSLEEYNWIKDKNLHLGVFSEPCLSYMLNGEKTIESRFSLKRQVPYERIDKEDVVIVKKSSGGVVAYFTIKEVQFIDLEKESIQDIKFKYNKELCVSDEFWEQKKKSRYATLLFVDKLVLVEPFKIHKKGMQSWVTLGKL